MTQVYDYVIVGAGSAGCVLAARLSEDPDVKVALLEAGGPDTAPEIHIPVAFPALFKSSLDWDLLGEPEPGLDGRRLYLPRGKVLGGSSSINAMIYIRGNRADYDEWAAMGADGWGYDDVLPYFKRAEDNERGEDRLPRRRRAAERQREPLDAPARRRDDRGRAARPATSTTRTSTAPARRASAASSSPSATACAAAPPSPTCTRPMERPNLDVITGAHGARGSCSRATAPSASRSRAAASVEEVRAEREVILSAGAYQSPRAADAVGHRARPRTSSRWRSRCARTCRSARTSRTTCMAQVNYLTDEQSRCSAR